jgi:hypothetical protein
MIGPYGFTNEREAILTWLRKKKECPMTKQKLYISNLRFNKNVYNLIHYLVLKEEYNKKHVLTKITDEEILR